ncbi:MAG: hypothetical protein H7Y20_10915 [Bryobacteraceae bacterium]|nr:hypothetical protein [Bryobacteraceae bacterium]
MPPENQAIPEILRGYFWESVCLNSSDTDRTPLRIGVLANGMHLPACFAAVLDQISRCNFARIAAVAFEPSALSAETSTGAIAWSQFSRLAEQKSGEAAEIFRPIDCTRWLADVSNFTEVGDLDVLLDFRKETAPDTFDGSFARYGLWRYRYRDTERYPPGPPYFQEIYANDPCSAVTLEALTTEAPEGLILHKLVASSVMGMWYGQNQIGPVVGAADMMLCSLHRLHEKGWDAVKARSAPAPGSVNRRVNSTPGNITVAAYVAHRAAASVSARIQNSKRPIYHWRSAIRPDRSGEDLPDSVEGINEIATPVGTALADPFLLTHKGRLWLFVEQVFYHDRVGRLACAEIRSDGTPGEFTTILDTGSHLSFPFVFEDGDSVFMIPESSAAGKVWLYRAVDFPYVWKMEKMLFPYAAVDTTLHVQDGVYWFFTCLADPPLGAKMALLFRSDSLFGQWIPHEANPISSDIRYARSSGRILRSHGRLIRQAQDGALRYGHAIRFSQITKLTPSAYEEAPVSALIPEDNSGMLGIHTYDRAGGFEVFDYVQQEPIRGIAI